MQGHCIPPVILGHILLAQVRVTHIVRVTQRPAGTIPSATSLHREVFSGHSRLRSGIYAIRATLQFVYLVQ